LSFPALIHKRTPETQVFSGMYHWVINRAGGQRQNADCKEKWANRTLPIFLFRSNFFVAKLVGRTRGGGGVCLKKFKNVDTPIDIFL
jgi:hypothetical protein